MTSESLATTYNQKRGILTKTLLYALWWQASRVELPFTTNSCNPEHQRTIKRSAILFAVSLYKTWGHTRNTKANVIKIPFFMYYILFPLRSVLLPQNEADKHYIECLYNKNQAQRQVQSMSLTCIPQNTGLISQPSLREVWSKTELLSTWEFLIRLFILLFPFPSHDLSSHPVWPEHEQRPQL